MGTSVCKRKREVGGSIYHNHDIDMVRILFLIFIKSRWLNWNIWESWVLCLRFRA